MAWLYASYPLSDPMGIVTISSFFEQENRNKLSNVILKKNLNIYNLD
jgi:hypothetical protein